MTDFDDFVRDRAFIIGGTFYKVAFAKTYVELFGHGNTTGGGRIEWWLRLGKEFYVGSDQDGPHLVDVVEGPVVPGVECLIRSVDQDITEFSCSPSRLRLVVDSGNYVEMRFTSTDGDCGEFEASRVENDGKRVPITYFLFPLRR